MRGSGAEIAAGTCDWKIGVIELGDGPGRLQVLALRVRQPWASGRAGQSAMGQGAERLSAQEVQQRQAQDTGAALEGGLVGVLNLIEADQGVG